MMLTLFHDYTSPASAVAVARLERLAREGLAVEFEGFEALGVDVALPVTVEVLDALEQLSGAAAAEGIVLRRPPALPPTGHAHVIGGVAEAHGRGPDWRRACYAAFWARGVDLADPGVLTGLAADAGLDAAAVREALADRGRLPALRRRMTGHRREGVGGVPTILAHRTLVPGLLPEDDLRTLAALG
jgi:predicted DsbA family dithiol-disulfide isomerase